MKVLITGVAGFIGSALAKRLISLGDDVIGIDNLDPYYDPAIKRHNLRSIGERNFKFFEGDITQREVVEDLMKHKLDIIIHLAAKAGVRASFQDPSGYARTNIVGTLNLLEAARTSGIDDFIFASSSSVYGDTSKVPYREDEVNTKPISPYGLTKFHGEAYCRLYAEVYGMNINALRFFTVYGPGQRPDMAIHRFIRSIDRGQKIVLFGDGSTYRDYTYIDDIVRGVEGAMHHTDGFRIYNLGSGNPIKLLDMVSTIADLLGKDPDIEYSPIPPGDMLRTYADISRARKELGYSPSVDFTTGVKREIEWIHRLESLGILK